MRAARSDPAARGRGEDAPGQGAAAADELARDSDLQRLLGATQPAGHTVEPERAIERAGRDRELGIEVVQLPTQPLLGAPPLVDQVVAMVDQQLQLAQRSFTRPRPIEPRLTQSGLATARASIGSDLPRARPARRSGAISFGGTRTNDSPAASSARSSAPVSCRQSSTAHSRSGSSEADPNDKLSRRADRQFRDRAPDLVNDYRRQRLLVHVHPDHDHSDRLLQMLGRPASGQTSLEAAATLLSGHARRSREGGGDTTLESQPSVDVQE